MLSAAALVVAWQLCVAILESMPKFQEAAKLCGINQAAELWI